MKRFISFIIGVIIFSGLPLIGWGLKDIGGFAQNPYRLAFIFIMAILTVFVVIFIPNEGRSQEKWKKIIKRQNLSLFFLQTGPIFIVLISPYFDHHRIAVFNENDNTRIIGLILSLIGFLFMNWSTIILGKQFSTDIEIQENHKLVTNGPYKYIRHPRYLGIIVFYNGISMIFISWISLILVFLLTLVLLWRISDEEKLMHQEFKTEWEDYKKRTFFLIPYIY
jgi:protein-S-isoprenylcysteine O-methyltransferase Ste14